MKAGIIAAGLGERLSSGGLAMAKPLVPIHGEPMIARLIRLVAEAGITSLCCIINEKSPSLETYLAGRSWPLPFELVRKSTPNSMESLFTLAPLLRESPFLLFTVDTIFRDSTLRRFLTGVRALPVARAVLALTRFSDDEKPLRVKIGLDHKVKSMGEAVHGGPGTMITAGFYWFDPSVFELMEEARLRGLGALRQFLCFLLEAGCGLYGISVAKTIDVDRPEDLAQAEAFLARRDVRP